MNELDKSYSDGEITKAILRSQHTQRNWNLEKKIPFKDMELIIKSVTECPSKQNIAFYNVHFITNRDMIEKIHKHTDGFTYSETGVRLSETNSQVLANLLIVFEQKTLEELGESLKSDFENRNDQTQDFLVRDSWTEDDARQITRDSDTAVGVAAGYANLASTLLGYETGCCQCMDQKKIEEIVGLKGKAMLLMGIGYGNENKNRRRHHIRDEFVFPTKKKMKIDYKFWK